MCYKGLYESLHYLHTAIVQQDPRTTCDGFKNLLDTPISNNITCRSDSEDCDSIECFTLVESFIFTLSYCNETLQVVIVNQSVNTIQPMPQTQQLNFGTNEYLNISFQLATEEYYILGLNSSFGLMFPLTAIPKGFV